MRDLTTIDNIHKKNTMSLFILIIYKKMKKIVLLFLSATLFVWTNATNIEAPQPACPLNMPNPIAMCGKNGYLIVIEKDKNGCAIKYGCECPQVAMPVGWCDWWKLIPIKDWQCISGYKCEKKIEIPKNCISWYDGCNTCSVKDGKIGMCTQRACFRQWTPKCLKYKNTCPSLGLPDKIGCKIVYTVNEQWCKIPKYDCNIKPVCPPLKKLAPKPWCKIVVEKDRLWCEISKYKCDICPMNYAPVCGKVKAMVKCIKAPCPDIVSYKTFSNSCFAKKAWADIVYLWKCKLEINCSNEYKPVCATNNYCPEWVQCFAKQINKTYKNECEAKIYGTKILYQWKCKVLSTYLKKKIDLIVSTFIKRLKSKYSDEVVLQKIEKVMLKIDKLNKLKPRFSYILNYLKQKLEEEVAQIVISK